MEEVRKGREMEIRRQHEEKDKNRLKEIGWERKRRRCKEKENGESEKWEKERTRGKSQG